MIKKLIVRGAIAVGLLLVVLIAMLLWPLPDPPRNGLVGDFAVVDVTVLDVESGELMRHQDVIIRSGIITSVGPTGASQPDGSLTIIDGAGKFLMPGLWDMHTHSLKISPQYMHPLFIANGVTGVRDMSGCMSEPDSLFGCIEDRVAWNEARRASGDIAPRYVLQSSFQINGGSEVPAGLPEYFRARNAAEARALVSFYRDAGADFLKIYTELSPESYQLLADEARRQGLAIAGHRPLRVSLEELLAAGQVSVEHPRLFLFECHSGAMEFRNLPDPLARYDAAFRRQMIENHDSERCAALMGAMAASDTWWTPTLQVLRMGAMAANGEFRSDERVQFIPSLFRQFMWAPDADRAATESELNGALYQTALEHVGQAHAGGVKILVGTDAGDTYIYPGFAMHEELVQLVRAGIPPADVLRAATSMAARFAGMDSDYGAVTEGRVGDLLLLDANPLEDIRHTRLMSGLLFDGRYYDRAALDELLEFAEEQAGSFRLNLHLFWDAVNSPLFLMQVAD